MANRSRFASSKGFILGTAFALILGGLWYIGKRPAKDSMVPIFGGRELSHQQLDQIEIAFSAQSLTGWVRESGRILIPRETKHVYLAVLKDTSALPYTLKSSVEEALGSGGFFESDQQRRSKLQYAKARDLGKRISASKTIAWASVDYDQQSSRGFEESTLHSASVTIVPADNRPLSVGEIRSIQRQVAASYAGMTPDQVTVTDLSTQKSFSGSEDVAIRYRRECEYELEQRLAKLLSGYDGLQIAVTSSGNPSQHVDGTESGDSGPLRMGVSVGIPESQFQKHWRSDLASTQRTTASSKPPSDQELERVRQRVIGNIRDAIAPFVSTEDDLAQSIRIWSYPDTTPSMPSSSATTGNASIQNAAAYVRTHAIAIGALSSLIVVAGLLMIISLRMKVRSTHPDFVPISADNAEHQSIHISEDKSLKEDLAELVEANPELAAEIVHRWMKGAA